MTESHRIINVHLAFRNIEATEAIKTYATDKVTHCLQKFVHQDTEAHVILRVERNRHIAEATFHSGGADFVVSEESDNLYASIDKMIDILTHQLRKHKEKVTAHH